MEPELDPDLHARIVDAGARGDTLAEAGEFEAAIGVYHEGWALIPEPRTAWDASTWMLAAIADAAFLGGFPDTARQALDAVMSCPGALGNPFLHLRRGQVLLDQHEPDAATDELQRAYMGGGPEIFEDDDLRYLDFLAGPVDLT